MMALIRTLLGGVSGRLWMAIGGAVSVLALVGTIYHKGGNAREDHLTVASDHNLITIRERQNEDINSRPSDNSALIDLLRAGRY